MRRSWRGVAFCAMLGAASHLWSRLGIGPRVICDRACLNGMMDQF